LTEEKVSNRDAWLTASFYADSLRIALSRARNSLEWSLSSPPKPHAFTSLPLQSAITY